MTSALMLAISLLTPGTGFARPELLIEAGELVACPGRFVIVDVRPIAEHESGRIPGAAWIDVRTWDKAFDPGDAEGWSRRLGDAGLDPAQPILIHGGDDVRDSARLWWILRYWGFRDVRLLNGGWGAWRAACGCICCGPAAPREPRRVRVQPQAAVHAAKSDVVAALQSPKPQLIDARSSDEYCGAKAPAKHKGRIPGAVHLEWTETLDPATKRFKSADELQALIRERRIDLDAPVVTYCQSGGRAAVVAFVLELMGGRQVRNYYKSWSEWGNADDTPIEIKPAGPLRSDNPR